ncbi:MAG: hypothetical protein A4E59_01167 [Syntrophorhabdus sp. PtaB.Bin027]|nr:MAG: hypothetical protein A4E59_01167 [Syntrophorhabdus sp. PtaB.Bin027]
MVVNNPVPCNRYSCALQVEHGGAYHADDGNPSYTPCHQTARREKSERLFADLCHNPSSPFRLWPSLSQHSILCLLSRYYFYSYHSRYSSRLLHSGQRPGPATGHDCQDSYKIPDYSHPRHTPNLCNVCHTPKNSIPVA